MKKIIVLGANGMAGHVVTLGIRAEAEKYNVIAVARTNSPVEPDVLMNVSDFGKLKDLIDQSKADVVINCIGLLNKNAEDHIDQAILLNSYLPHFLETITKNSDTKVIHISTDCVFSGKKGGYLENDFKDGTGFYAQSKALGEIVNQKDLTIRTSIIGTELKDNGIGLFDWFSKQKGTINGYTQAFWTGVTTVELMKAVKSAIEQDVVGLYHLVYLDKISKYDLVQLFAKRFDRAEVKINPDNGYKVDKSLLNTRTDFNYAVPNYDEMIKEMKEWMANHTEIYPHYKHLFEV
jgi:dTDP-4-dehydrorhamnose reductase